MGLQRNLNDCSLHHFTPSQSVLKFGPWTFSSISKCLAKFESGTFRPTVGGWVRGIAGRGTANSIARPCVLISSRLTRKVYLQPFDCNFKGGLFGPTVWGPMGPGGRLQKLFHSPARPTRIGWQLPLWKRQLRRAAKTNGKRITSASAICRPPIVQIVIHGYHHNGKEKKKN